MKLYQGEPGGTRLSLQEGYSLYRSTPGSCAAPQLRPSLSGNTHQHPPVLPNERLGENPLRAGLTHHPDHYEPVCAARMPLVNACTHDAHDDDSALQLHNLR